MEERRPAALHRPWWTSPDLSLMCCAKVRSQRPSCSGPPRRARARIRSVTANITTMSFRALDEEDPEIANLIRHEFKRQSETLELIASENLTSPAILEALGTLLTNKYAEGYPGRRYYGGTGDGIDQIETLAVQPA